MAVPPVLPPVALNPAPVQDSEIDDIAGATTAPAVDDVPPPDPAALRALGMTLRSRFAEYKMDRRGLEQQWERSWRQNRGIYDPETLQQIEPNRSKTYPKLTRVKCVSMVSRLMNLLFPSSEKNYTITASPVPNLSTTQLTKVIADLKQSGAPLTDESITDAVNTFARARALSLEQEIADQLAEIGGSRNVSYIALARRVLMSGVMYGAGVLEGPSVRKRQQRRWTIGTDGTAQAVDETIMVPEFDFVPLWDYYPDLSAKYLHQMDGQFRRIVMSRQQVRTLADMDMFFSDIIRKYLESHVDGNYKEEQFETMLRVMGETDAKPLNAKRKFEVTVWNGAMSGRELKGCGVIIPADREADMFKCVVWLIDDTVIRCNLNPWVALGENAQINNYHLFVFEEDESSLLGTGLPQIMRDSQMAVCSSARMIMDNASVVCGPQMEVNDSLLVAGTDSTGITPHKIWHRDDESPATANIPAVRAVEIASHLTELQAVNSMFREFADQETFVNPQTGGDMSKGPSEPFRTAAGASMLQGLAALPFRDAVRGFDMFTESVIGSLVAFNKHFSTKESVKGDFQVVARGSTSLVAKEVRGIGFDSLATTLKPEEALYVNWKGVLRERLLSRDIDPSEAMCSDAEAKQREDAQAQAASQHQQQQDSLIQAQVKKLVADAVKALTQSDKNTANAQSATYDSITTGLHKGVTPIEAADAKAGTGGVPASVAEIHRIQHPEPQPPKESVQ